MGGCARACRLRSSGKRRSSPPPRYLRAGKRPEAPTDSAFEMPRALAQDERGGGGASTAFVWWVPLGWRTGGLGDMTFCPSLLWRGSGAHFLASRDLGLLAFPVTTVALAPGTCPPTQGTYTGGPQGRTLGSYHTWCGRVGSTQTRCIGPFLAGSRPARRGPPAGLWSCLRIALCVAPWREMAL